MKQIKLTKSNYFPQKYAKGPSSTTKKSDNTHGTKHDMNICVI